MGMTQYLAMTAAEFRSAGSLPGHTAWMGCHFSPYGLGLSNLPTELPEGSLLVVDDITPIHYHNPDVMVRQLEGCIQTLGICGVLLDFQRPGVPEYTELIPRLCQGLPCPVAVSAMYGRESTGPVFLSPIPCHDSLGSHLESWPGREIWLEIALSRQMLTLTEDGCALEDLCGIALPEDGFSEERLHCHYHIQKNADEIRFLLWRTREDLHALIQEAEGLGIRWGIGLYQELGPQI